MTCELPDFYHRAAPSLAFRFARRSTPALLSSCNAGCRCEGLPYDPVCGADNVLYYSPCHAGCTKETMLDSARVGDRNQSCSYSGERASKVPLPLGPPQPVCFDEEPHSSVMHLQVYTDCACVNAHSVSATQPPTERRRRRRYTAPGDDPEEDGEGGAFQRGRSGAPAVEYDAINEPCSSGCDLLWVFIGLAFFTMLVTFLVTMPALTATLR